jgi:two-component system CheB/CheR fusion protein
MDITERKRQEEALKQGEIRWRTMAEALPNLVWTDLPDGTCDWLSSQWRTYTGVPLEELLGYQWLEKVIHPDDQKRTLACWQAACEDKADYDLEYRIRRHDGEYRWFKTRGVPIRDGQGRILHWFGTCTDIQDSKQMEESLREDDRRKDEFLATLAHELRNPLAPLQNGLQIMKLTEGNGSLNDLHAMMKRQLDQMIRLIDDLLDISRVSRGKLQLRRKPIVLQDVVLQAIEMSEPLIKASEHNFSAVVPEVPIYVNADAVRLTQVFGNILNNAAKYTPRSGTISLVISTEKGEVVTSIKDTGIGIPTTMLSRIFELFTQVDHSLEKSQGGLGIGLTLAHRLIELHCGKIVAKSEGEGCGSEFIVTLPLVTAPRLGTKGNNVDPVAINRRRVLVVDDNRDSAITLEMMLEMMGQEVRKAHDGREAIAIASTFLPELILMDVGMPKLNGLDATRLIRETPWGKNIRIMALTGWGQDDDKKKSQAAGCDGHLVKPVQPMLLQKVLAEI